MGLMFNEKNPADNAGVAIKLKKGIHVTPSFAKLNPSALLDSSEEIIVTDMKAANESVAYMWARETFQRFPAKSKTVGNTTYIFANMSDTNITTVIEGGIPEGFIRTGNKDSGARNIAATLLKKSH